MRRLLPVTVVALLLLAGCGASGGDDDAETTTTSSTTTTEDEAALTEDDYLGAFTEQLTSGAEGNLAFDDETGACIAAAWVDAIGVEALQESGIPLEELSDPDFDISSELEVDAATAERLVQAFIDCDADLIGEFAATITDEDPDATQCIVDQIDPDEFYAGLSEAFSTGDDGGIGSLLLDAGTACDVDF